MNLQFKHHSIVLTLDRLRYNPCDDVIFPSVVKAADYLENALGTYYMYYAPHDTPGGVCLAYSNSLEGPWVEYDANPIITKQWEPHYNVSHVSSPHVMWLESASCLYLYFHGENDTTRIASSTDGIHFEYEGIAVLTALYDEISEASYARVFPCNIASRDANYILLFMGNNHGTRRIYAAWSRDAKNFEAERAPLVSPPPGSGVTQVGGPWFLPLEDRNLIVFHGDKTDDRLNDVTSDLYLVDVGADFSRENHLGLFYPRQAISEDIKRVSDPCIFEDSGERYLFSAVGPRLHQQIALARQIN